MSTQGKQKLVIRAFKIAETLLLIGTVGMSLIFFVIPITLEVEYIPTVINGITAAVSITIGFLAFSVTFFVGGEKLEVRIETQFRLMIYFMWPLMAMSLMVLGYFFLTQSDLVPALRISFVTFIISASLLVDYVGYAMRLHLMKNKNMYERMEGTKIDNEKEHQEKQKQKPFWKKLVEYHADFLKAIKTAYPLGVLSSLSIATAAFISTVEENSLVLAQTYAITAALLFLTAFTFSFFLNVSLLWPETSSTVYPAIISYICTGGGVVFLFLVIKEFLLSMLSVTKVILPILMLILCVIVLFPVSFFIHIAKASKSKDILVVGVAAVLSDLVFVSTLVAATLSAYDLIAQLPSWWGNLIPGSAYALIVLMTLTPVLAYVKIRKKRK